MMITLENIQRHRREFNEMSDCVVTSLAIVGQISYRKAHFITEMSGREHRTGFWTADVVDLARKYGINLVYIEPSERMTVKKFCSIHKTGRYIIESKFHALPVIDGVVMDKSGRNAIVENIFKLDGE
jgi:hypothetical protein